MDSGHNDAGHSVERYLRALTAVQHASLNGPYPKPRYVAGGASGVPFSHRRDRVTRAQVKPGAGYLTTPQPALVETSGLRVTAKSSTALSSASIWRCSCTSDKLIIPRRAM